MGPSPRPWVASRSLWWQVATLGPRLHGKDLGVWRKAEQSETEEERTLGSVGGSRTGTRACRAARTVSGRGGTRGVVRELEREDGVAGQKGE